MLASSGFTKTSSGYPAVSDGWSDLRDDFRHGLVVRRPVHAATSCRPGAPASPACQEASTSPSRSASRPAPGARRRRPPPPRCARGFADARQAYSAGWHAYLRLAAPAPASAGAWQRRTTTVSAMVLAAQRGQDLPRRFRRRARPAVGVGERSCSTCPSTTPSGPATSTRSPPACSPSATGPRPTARWTTCGRVQQRPDGSFPQNSRLDGEPVFGGLQMDEVAFPIVLAWQLGRTGPRDWEHVTPVGGLPRARTGPTPRRSAGRTSAATRRPPSPRRSPAWCAPPTSPRRNGRPPPPSRYLRDRRQLAARASSSWTVTDATGRYSADPYYLRITANGDANSGDADPDLRRRAADRPAQGRRPELPRAGPARREAGRRPRRAQLAAGGRRRSSRYTTPNGSFWHRAELRRLRRDSVTAPSGSRSTPDRGVTIGRGWPLLTGERGEYDLAADAGRRPELAGHDGPVRRRPEPAAGRAGLGPPAARRRRPAASARARPPSPPPRWPGRTPSSSGWPRSIDAGAPVETPQVVACRYTTTHC